jgi:hypothetical protein
MLMIGKSVAAALLFLSACSGARAQNCKELPPGPARFECASRIHPGLVAKRERCRQEGQQMGIKAGVADRGNLKQYVMSCMQRR